MNVAKVNLQESQSLPQSGLISGGEHLYPLRVYYDNTDASGIVYHSAYLEFAERARTELLRCLNISQWAMRAETGKVFAVRTASLDFQRPARLDDALLVRTHPVKLAGASVTLTQRVECDGHLLVAVNVCVACMDAETGRAARIPKDVRERLMAFAEAGQTGAGEAR